MGSEKVQSGPLEFDIPAREAQVVGERQRIMPLDQGALTEETRKLSAAIRGTFGIAENGPMVPETFATMGKHPGAFRCQLEMGMELIGRGVLPPRERELAILRVGWLCRAPFEWGEHVNFARRCGVSAEEIERVTHGSSAQGWNAHERAVLRAVEELLGDQSISDETWAVLAKSWTERQLMELPVLVGHYFATALLHHSLRISLLDSNPGLRHR